jgi:ribonuclease P protein component
MDRAHRLPKGPAFDRTYREGTVFSGPLLVLRVIQRENQPTRWGFAVGKRISKKAVVRNRIRRRLREAARTLSVPEGYDIVVNARNGTIDADYERLKIALARLIQRAGILEEAG